MDDRIYWIYAQLALGAGSRKSMLAAEHFGGMKEFCFAPPKTLAASRLFTRIELAKIQAAELDDAKRVLDKCDRAGIHVLTPQDENYPNRLRNIAAPPAVLYSLGTLPQIDDEVLVSIVGTRAATPYGRRAAQLLGMQLARSGAVVVSGGAVGVDTDAHTGALTVSGRTVAVLGCAINYPYLMQNHELREQIVRRGALLSEYPPGTPPSKTTFPCRNRIISGLSLGTVIIEAGAKSGSLITANHALEQGRDVFVLPGSETSPNYAGSVRLLADGAKPVRCAADILEEYVSFFPHRLTMKEIYEPVTDGVPERIPHAASVTDSVKFSHARSEETKQPEQIIKTKEEFVPQGVSQLAILVYNAFDTGTLQCDEIVRGSNLPVEQVLSAITELELMGYIEALPGKQYRIIPKEV